MRGGWGEEFCVCQEGRREGGEQGGRGSVANRLVRSCLRPKSGGAGAWGAGGGGGGAVAGFHDLGFVVLLFASNCLRLFE